MWNIWEAYFRKHRAIVFVVAGFVALDVCVLALNFYTSFQIDRDIVSIDLAGRERYLSQRIARTLGELDADRAAGRDRTAAVDELRGAADSFQRSLLVPRVGNVASGGAEEPLRASATATPRVRAIQNDIEELWNPYRALLDLIVGKPEFSGEELTAALVYSRAYNAPLLDAANRLVAQTRAIGASRTSQLRLIQVAGIFLLLLKLAGIGSWSLRRRLRAARGGGAAPSAAADGLRAAKEGSLGAKEGSLAAKEASFLVDRAFRVGASHSTALPMLLGRAIEPGADFRALLSDLVAPPVQAAACDYLEMLFEDRLKESLVTLLNPLNVVKLATAAPDGVADQRFVALEFSRVLDGSRVSHLLATVLDVTARVERSVETTEKKSRIEALVAPLKLAPMPAVGS